MYHPTSRVLTVLELLQSRPSITGPELATRLEMNVRTVRRYIAHLQDVGIPVEANIGRSGGYRLRPGFKLPPLMFNEEEATSVMLGLLASAWLEIGQSPLAIEGALAKVSRILPMQARERLQAVSSHLILFPHNQQDRPDASLLIDLSVAVHASQCIVMDYLSQNKQSTHRKVEPYGITGWKGRWYLVGYCCLRQDYRVFRLDRVQHVEILAETFEKAREFDYEAFMRAKYTSDTILVEVEFQASLDVVQQRMTAVYGTLTPTETGVLLQEQYDDIEGMARYLMAVNLPFVVHNPPELRDALRRLGERIIQIASASLPDDRDLHQRESSDLWAASSVKPPKDHLNGS
ncbi:MAG: YafY family transcriptional regulator [Ktedonobacteraceae bacterium]|nr:YafY family transcriptional regulator [Ktedonobacteraceae bacterium]